MGARIRAHDWSGTPLGPIDTWPQSLRSAISILLPSKAQIVLFWGPELIAIYNDAEDQTYVYLHMLRPSGLKRGGQVGAGDQVGAMGCTGSCYGVHLHFEVRLGRGVEGKPIDPLPMLKRWPQIPEPE